MNSVIVERLPRIEGDLRVLLSQTDAGSRAFLQSGRSTHLDKRLRGRFPLEAPQLTQTLSSNSCVAHAVAAVSALEDYLHIFPTETGLRVRQVMLDMAAIRSHIYHFYWQVLPNYLNEEHFESFKESELWFYTGIHRKQSDKEDLPKEIGIQIMQHAIKAARIIDLLQKNLTMFGGKYPVIMNQIPGGVSNFAIGRSLKMAAIRNLEQCKEFIEVIWPQDVKDLIGHTPGSVTVLGKQLNLLSFGSLAIDKNKGKTSNYSEGALLHGKLEPVNELKITETVDNTFYLPVDKIGQIKKSTYDFNKPDAKTWVKGARYQGETMLTGPLSRMMVTHLAGGNLEISDMVGQIIDDLELTFDRPNCIASRLLAEVMESRIFLKNTLINLLDFDDTIGTNQKTSFSFSAKGVGVGKIESPGGSLMHQIFIKNGRIEHYRIVSSMNWNFAPADKNGDSGEVEHVLNAQLKAKGLKPLTASRILHSYYPLTLDGTQ